MYRAVIVTALLLALGLSGRAQSLQIPDDEPIRYLALGDSYTIGQGVTIPERWPEQFRDSLEARGLVFDTLSIIAQTGWATGPLLNAITGRGLANRHFNLVSLLIGVNNQFQGGSTNLYSIQFNQLLDSAIVYAGGDVGRVLVLSIPDYTYSPFGQNWPAASTEIDLFNNINRTICTSRNIAYIDITDISRSFDESLITSDGLHPSGLHYSLWVQRIMASLGDQLPTAAFPETDPIAGLFPIPAKDGVQLKIPESANLEQGRVDLVHAATAQIVLSMPLIDLVNSGMLLTLPGQLANGTYQVVLYRPGKPPVARSIVVLR